jgi:hypothetical protein
VALPEHVEAWLEELLARPTVAHELEVVRSL